MLKSVLIKRFIIIKDLLYTYKLTFQYRNVIKEKTKNKPKKLNKTQISEIQEYYSKYGYTNINTAWHDFYFSSNNFYSVEYVPEDIFHATISKRLNQMRQWPSLLDKNLLGLIFKDFYQPEVVIKNMNGFYFLNGIIVSQSVAVEKVNNVKKQMVIKPSIESGDGQGVEPFLIHNGKTNYKDLSVKEMFSHYKKDFIIQIVVAQDLILKSLNPSSLNTLRVLSYMNNNGVHVLSTIVRIGKLGSFTDNCSTGGIACGVSEKGELKKEGYLNEGSVKLYTENGILLEGIKIPSYKIIVNQVKKMHLLIPYFQLVSWDIAIDINGLPILIEYNTYHQDITIHQLANGPLFGSFTNEILKCGATKNR